MRSRDESWRLKGLLGDVAHDIQNERCINSSSKADNQRVRQKRPTRKGGLLTVGISVSYAHQRVYSREPPWNLLPVSPVAGVVMRPCVLSGGTVFESMPCPLPRRLPPLRNRGKTGEWAIVQSLL